MRISKIIGGLTIIFAAAIFALAQDQNAPKTEAPKQTLTEWKDEFEGKALDETTWEQYSIEGPGIVKVADGKLKTEGGNGGSRAGIRTVKMFKAERFLVSGKLSKVEPGTGMNWANAILTVLFDNSGTERLEWLITADGRFEAWLIRDGKSERIDNSKLGTQEKSPTLGIARKGDEFFFMLNGEVGFSKKIKNVSKNFKVMLYGFGTSKNEWEMASIITPAQ